MKFINYIEKVSGVDIYGLISLGIFVVFFLVVLIRVYKADKKKIKEISQLPLDN
ncbi:MAG: CcoQ/FixQ family Cbb3-type cytochrome c oxidase assembly chaperone [Bacteroidetes bacterium]|nr:CcoQ/FixQ family Cbb3-type cytochrome c oxidase assembly chaperone [Bacteroidota bacterium]